MKICLDYSMRQKELEHLKEFTEKYNFEYNPSAIMPDCEDCSGLNKLCSQKLEMLVEVE